MSQIPVFDIARGSSSDGPGIRTVIFLQGCPLRCPWCHNPESQLSEPLTSSKNHLFESEELLTLLLRDKPYYQVSGGGVTFSGGEPLGHAAILGPLCKSLGEHDIPVAFDTSGYFNYNDFKQYLHTFTDTVLFDLKIIDEELSQRVLGVNSRSIISNLEKLCGSGLDITVRIPIIPGFTTTDTNLAAVADLMTRLQIEQYNMLSYNPSFVQKLTQLGRSPDPSLPDAPLSLTQENEIRKRFAGLLKNRIRDSF